MKCATAFMFKDIVGRSVFLIPEKTLSFSRAALTENGFSDLLYLMLLKFRILALRLILVMAHYLNMLLHFPCKKFQALLFFSCKYIFYVLAGKFVRRLGPLGHAWFELKGTLAI